MEDWGDFGNFGESFDPNASPEEMHQKTQEALDTGLDFLNKMGQKWQGNTPNDELARGMIAAGTVQIGSLRDALDEGIEDPRTLNPLILTLAIKTFEQHMRFLMMLKSLGDLTK